jgi:Cu/Ag efflux protein CusF
VSPYGTDPEGVEQDFTQRRKTKMQRAQFVFKNMKTSLLFLAALFMWSCGQSASHNHNSSAPAAATPVPTASIPKDGDYPGKGVVTKVDTEAGWVEIDHEPIEEVMPQKMTMMFNVNDKSILKGINAGDKVDFVLEYKHPKETVKSIRKIQ